MKLYLIDEKNDKKHLDVKFWSYMKFNILAQLTIFGIFYGAFFVLGMFAGILLALMGI